MCGKYQAIKWGKQAGNQRYHCQSCNKYFTKSNKKRISVAKILIDHLDGFSYRKLSDRHNIPPKKICEKVNNLTARLKPNFEITEFFIEQLCYSGHLIVDGKYVPVKEEIETQLSSNILKGKIPRSKKRRKVLRGKVLIWGADYMSHDIPHYEFDDSENSDVFDKYFRKLKSIGYPLISVTIDDRKEIAWAAKRNFRNCIIQQCIRHYFTKISKELAIGNIRRKIRSLENKIDKLFDNVDSDYLPVTRWQSIKLAIKYANEIAELEHKYELLIDFQNAIQSILWAKKYQTAIYRIESLEKYFWPRRFEMRKQYDSGHINTVKKLVADFKEHKEYLLNYLKYPHLDIPSTTNLIEGCNSQLELRLTSIRGFEIIKAANDYINIWIIKRRFTKFKCCRGKFKSLNGKTPLECAGADISSIRNWIKWCQK